MAREKEGYRLCLEELNRVCPDKLLLSRGEVKKALGVSYQTVERHYGRYFDGKYIPKTELARLMCNGKQHF
jgi:hypothetical protein